MYYTKRGMEVFTCNTWRAENSDKKIVRVLDIGVIHGWAALFLAQIAV